MLGAGQIDAHALDRLSTLPHLRVLQIQGGDYLEDAEVRASRNEFKHLDELDIWWSRQYVPGRTWRPLPIASWAGLRSLALSRIPLSPDEVRAISRLGKLTKLRVSDFWDDDLLLLREMKGLKKAHLESLASEIKLGEHRRPEQRAGQEQSPSSDRRRRSNAHTPPPRRRTWGSPDSVFHSPCEAATQRGATPLDGRRGPILVFNRPVRARFHSEGQRPSTDGEAQFSSSFAL